MRLSGLKNIKSKIFPVIPKNNRTEIKKLHLFENLTRLQQLISVLIPIHLLLFYLDYRHKLAGDWENNEGYVYLYYLHLAMFIILMIFFTLNFIKKPGNPEMVTIRHSYSEFIFLFIFLLWSAIVTGIDQLIHGSISVFILSLFATAVLISIRTWQSIIIFGISFIVFIALITIFQEDHHKLFAHYTNGTILLIIGWLTSRLIYFGRVNDFINKRTIEIKNAELEESKSRADELLCNVLPNNVVEQINIEGYYSPELKENVTVVFTDFVGFTKIVEDCDSANLVEILDEFFQYFDYIIKKYNLEKIKTIGDGYMFAGGLFKDGGQIKEAIEASFEIIEFIKNRSSLNLIQTGHEWGVRIGIHHGPVIAGVIGKWRLTYDLWGKTVNIAAGLEEESEKDKINISEEIKTAIESDSGFIVLSRGKFPIKNMQPLNMYFIERKNNG
ncbi:MAG: adenylate/guanylate cyclase domain-containing protein [bacterium]|nr:adenylate/guanylate cyclase domain-containing protein [bacterium]